MLSREQEHLLLELEWAYTDGQSFSVGEDDLVRWMLENGWSITPPSDMGQRRFFFGDLQRG